MVCVFWKPWCTESHSFTWPDSLLTYRPICFLFDFITLILFFSLAPPPPSRLVNSNDLMFSAETAGDNFDVMYTLWTQATKAFADSLWRGGAIEIRALTACRQNDQMFCMKCQHHILFFLTITLMQSISSSLKRKVFDWHVGRPAVKDISVREVCHFNGDSLVFAAGCFLTVSDSHVNRQKAANDFFFLVNSCLMYSASWMHSNSSDVA